MIENSLRDPAPNLKTLVGLEEKVTNYRPLDKSKHVSKEAFRHVGLPKTQNEKFVEKASRVVSNYMVARDVGLPALNLKEARINKALDTIRKRAKGDNFTTNRDQSKDES